MLKSEPKKQQGKFWPGVRVMIWEKAQELYQQDEGKGMPNDFTGVTATKSELREGGYFHQAKLIVLRDLWLGKKGLPTTEEEEASRNSIQGFFQNK
jgi:hypothetical protein